jgi:hypothetical protein
LQPSLLRSWLDPDLHETDPDPIHPGLTILVQSPASQAEDFIRNLRGIDDGADVDRESLLAIYERIRAAEFKPGSDHVTQVGQTVWDTSLGRILPFFSY